MDRKNVLNPHLYAVILAGGSGTRFWPLSRERLPKQFLKILGNHSLLAETILRVRSKVDCHHIFIVTNVFYLKQIQQEIAPFRISLSQILLEPEGRNTAPAIYWAAKKISAVDRDALMAVFPSDHLILNKETFLRTFDEAIQLAEENFLVTLGIPPTRPETGFGYLKAIPKNLNGQKIHKIKFTEKPSLSRAKRFLKTKRYFWNSGIFFWKAKIILKEFEKYQPAMVKIFKRFTKDRILRQGWGRLPHLSIDYGILEKSKKVVMVKAKKIGWSDLGSWESLAKILPKQGKENILKGNQIAIDCEKTMILSQNRLVAAIGVKDLIIIDTPNALLVCRKDFSQKVKDLISIIKKQNKHKYL